jgi:hypothetical protein
MTAPNYMRITRHHGVCIYRSGGDAAKQRCGAEFVKRNVCQVCCEWHTLGYSKLTPEKKKALRAAAGLS